MRVSIDSNELQNLRRAAGNYAAPKAATPKPKPRAAKVAPKPKPTVKPRTDPQRQAKLACIDATPLKPENRRTFRALVDKHPSYSLETVKASVAAERCLYTNAYDAKDRAEQIQAETKDESRRQTQVRSRMPFTLSAEEERRATRDADYGIGLVRCQVHFHGSLQLDRRLHVAQIESLRSQGAIIYPLPKLARR